MSAHHAQLRSALRPFVRPNFRLGLAYVLFDWTLYLSCVVLAVTLESAALRLLFGVIAGGAIAGLFVLAHDAAHNALTPNGHWNRALAYLCLAPQLHNYTLWRLQHNRYHHRLPNVKGYNSWSPLSPSDYRALPAWRRTLERFYRSGFGFWLYYLAQRWWRDKFLPNAGAVRGMDERFRRRAWLDVVPLCLYLAGLAWAINTLADFGADPSLWHALFFGAIVPYLVWNLHVGYTVYFQHTHPRLPWFRNAEELHGYGGQERVAVVVFFPRWYEFLDHWVLHHAAHHVYPLIPHYRLKAAQTSLTMLIGEPAIVERFNLRYAMDVVSRCKLFDYEAGCWTDFSGRATTPPLLAQSASR